MVVVGDRGAVVEPAPALAVDRLAQVHLVLLQGDGGGEDLHGGPGLVAVLHRVHLAGGLLPVLVLRGTPPSPPGSIRTRCGPGISWAGCGWGRRWGCRPWPGSRRCRDPPPPRRRWPGGAFSTPSSRAVLHEVLDGGVQGQLQGGAVHRDLGEVLLQDQQAALGVPGGDAAPPPCRPAARRRSSRCPAGPAPSMLVKPSDLAGQAAPGVLALALGQEVHPVQLEGADGGGLGRRAAGAGSRRTASCAGASPGRRRRRAQLQWRQLGRHLAGGVPVRLAPGCAPAPLPCRPGSPGRRTGGCRTGSPPSGRWPGSRPLRSRSSPRIGSMGITDVCSGARPGCR